MIRTLLCRPDSDELYDHLVEALEQGHGVRVLTAIDASGAAQVELTLYEEMPSLGPRDVDWWPWWEGWHTAQRLHLGEYAILDSLGDPRWHTHRVRALNFHLNRARCCAGDDGITLIDWVVDFSDKRLRGE